MDYQNTGLKRKSAAILATNVVVSRPSASYCCKHDAGESFAITRPKNWDLRPLAALTAKEP